MRICREAAVTLEVIAGGGGGGSPFTNILSRYVANDFVCVKDYFCFGFGFFFYVYLAF